MCICKPHLMMMTTHMSTAGSNALSASMRFAVPTVGCPPPKLLEPTRPMVPLPRNHRHCPRNGRVLRPATLDEAHLLSLVLNDSYGDPRSGTGTWSGGATGSAAAPVAHPSQVPRIQMTARRIRAASRRSSALPVEDRKHRESPPGRQSQPRGVRAHGAPLEAGNRCGAGTRWIADHSTADRRSPNLACKMRQRHAARVQTAQRRDPERPHGRDTEILTEPTGICARTPSGLCAFRDFPSGIRALRVYTVVGMCWVEGLTAALGSRRPAAVTGGEPWRTCWFCGPSGGRTGTT